MPAAPTTTTDVRGDTSGASNVATTATM
jgi:hypothetical protein